MKTCIKCKEVKDLSEFTKRKNSKDGHDYYCKTCKATMKRAEYLKNKESYTRRAREYRLLNPEHHIQKCREYYYKNQAEQLAKKAEYVAKNKVRIKAGRKAYYENNKEFVQQNCRDYYQANKHTGQWNVYSETRRARKSNAPGKFTSEEVRVLFQTQSGKCPYCGIRLEEGFHRDHIIPLARPELGPTNYISNIQLTCPECNLSKGDRTHEEYVEYLQKVDPTKYEKYLEHKDYIATKILLSDWRN